MSTIRILKWVLPIIMVIASKSYAQAPKCADLFNNTVRKSDAIPKLKVLTDIYSDFLTFLEPKVQKMIKGDLLFQSDVQEWLNKLDAASIDYFNDAGIEFKKIPVVRKDIQIEHVLLPAISYSVYKIESASQETPIGRLLNGILQQQKLKSLQTIYDPFLRIWMPGSPAFYNPRSKQVYFSFEALIYRVIGLSDPLRHELNHALEDSKVHRGEESLASFEFKNGKKQEHGYSGYLALDEAESYLRDLRFLKFSAAKQDVMIDNADRLEKLRAQRKTSIQNSVKIIRLIIASAKEVLNELKTVGPIASSQIDGVVNLVFVGLDNSKYSAATVTIGLKNNEKPIELLLQRITWAENRLLQIESELKQFEQ